MSMKISLAVESDIDEAVAKRLAGTIGAEISAVYGKKGKSFLRQHISAWNNAARFAPWLVLVDLDHDADCAPLLRSNWLRSPVPWFCFRVAVREVEAWLLADTEAIAQFFRLSVKKIPRFPEQLNDPKQTLINLARLCRKRAIREDIVPRPGSGRNVGPGYTSRMIEFIENFWRPEVAAQEAESLKRALNCIRRLISNDGVILQ